MVGTDAVCAQYTMPDGVTFSFQVCLYTTEPTVANRAFNLFAKDALRAALADEAEEVWPEVAVVGLGFPFAGRRERLAGATSGPHGSVNWPTGEPQGFVPSADSGEEVALNKSSKVSCDDFLNGPLINNSIGD